MGLKLRDEMGIHYVPVGPRGGCLVMFLSLIFLFLFFINKVEDELDVPGSAT